MPMTKNRRPALPTPPRPTGRFQELDPVAVKWVPKQPVDDLGEELGLTEELPGPQRHVAVLAPLAAGLAVAPIGKRNDSGRRVKSCSGPRGGMVHGTAPLVLRSSR